MASFHTARGCVYRVDSGSGGSGSPIIRVSPNIESGDDSPVLLTGVQTADQDLVLPVVTLDGAKILYTFGEDFGQFGIVGVCLLGMAGGTGRALGALVEWFSQHRVARSQESVSVTLGGGGAYRIFITSLNIAEADTEYGIQPFVVSGMVAKAP